MRDDGRQIVDQKQAQLKLSAFAAHIGDNDLLGDGRSPQATLENINEIIDALQMKNDSVVIFLEQIAPGRSDIMTSEFTSLFQSVQFRHP